MTQPALTLEELLNWNDESTRNWFGFLAANPAAQSLPCGIYGTEDILGLARHIVAVELRHSQRLAGLPVVTYEEIPQNSLAALTALHEETVARLRQLLADPAQNWAAILEFPTLSAGLQRSSCRKLFAHALLHGIRHWAQAATLARAAGFQPNFSGDLMLSSAIE